jgi:hypothetical protein
MAETLSHPASGVEPDGAGPTGTSCWQKVVGIVGLLVVLWVGDNMYDTVTGDLGGGPAGGLHGPGQNAPVENQDQAPDTDDGGGHTPPAGGHG